MDTNRRLMLMIDGDNAEASLLPQIITEVSKEGAIKIRRVYGDWETQTLRPWKECLATYALKPVQQFNYTPGKNATDIALIIDAMDFLYTVEVDGICIVSSDSDFTPLATRIREKGLFVMGIGKKSTPRAFVAACDKFVFTEILKSEAEDQSVSVPQAIGMTTAATPVSPDDNHDTSAFMALFKQAYEVTPQDEDGWAHLGTMGSQLRKLDPSFDTRTYNPKYKKIGQFVRAYPDLFVLEERETTGGNKDTYIRLNEE